MHFFLFISKSIVMHICFWTTKTKITKFDHFVSRESKASRRDISVCFYLLFEIFETMEKRFLESFQSLSFSLSLNFILNFFLNFSFLIPGINQDHIQKNLRKFILKKFLKHFPFFFLFMIFKRFELKSFLFQKKNKIIKFCYGKKKKKKKEV